MNLQPLSCHYWPKHWHYSHTTILINLHKPVPRHYHDTTIKFNMINQLSIIVKLINHYQSLSSLSISISQHPSLSIIIINHSRISEIINHYQWKSIIFKIYHFKLIKNCYFPWFTLTPPAMTSVGPMQICCEYTSIASVWCDLNHLHAENFPCKKCSGTWMIIPQLAIGWEPWSTMIN